MRSERTDLRLGHSNGPQPGAELNTSKLTVLRTSTGQVVNQSILVVALGSPRKGPTWDDYGHLCFISI